MIRKVYTLILNLLDFVTWCRGLIRAGSLIKTLVGFSEFPVQSAVIRANDVNLRAVLRSQEHEAYTRRPSKPVGARGRARILTVGTGSIKSRALFR